MTTLNPVCALIKAIGYYITGKIYFSKEYVHKTIIMEDKQVFKIFLYVVMNTKFNLYGFLDQFRALFFYEIIRNKSLNEYIKTLKLN